jgi:hypothetical protein
MQQIQNLASEDKTAMNCLQLLHEQGFMRDTQTKNVQSQSKYKTNYCEQCISSSPTPNNQSYLTTKVETRMKQCHHYCLTKAKKDKPQGHIRYCIKQSNQIIEKEAKNGWSQT